MKVEFLDSEVFGPELVISADEFLNGMKDENDFESLMHATEAFSCLFGVDYVVSREEYEEAAKVLENDGLVIFAICSGKHPPRRWCELYVSNNNQPIKVSYEDEEGRHLRRQGKYDPTAIERVRARHEAEEKKHE